MNILTFVILVALFVAVTPGVLVSLPAGGKKLTVALVHGLIFGVLWVIVWGLLHRAHLTHGKLFFEGLELPSGGAPAAKKEQPKH